MLESLLILIGLASPDYTASVAVESAVTIATYAAPATACKCGGKCVNGQIVHGDSHKTPCPCPPDCKCKTKGAIVHPPVIIKCENGACVLKK